jgi:putative ABC transport system substrate-binding protein
MRPHAVEMALVILRGCALAGLALMTESASSQPAGKVWRIGVLTADRPAQVEALREALRQLNYVEGSNLILERRRFASTAELPGVAAELVRLEPDLIVVGHGVAALAVKAATRTIPVVMASSNDAVAQGIVASLPRPGGNITGLTNMAPEVTAKRLEILREAAAGATRIAVLGCPAITSGSKAEWSGLQPAAKRMGIYVVPVFIRHANDLPAAFEMAVQQKIDAALVLECAFYPPFDQVTSLVNKSRVPAIYPSPSWVRNGALMGYGPDGLDQYRQAATFVDKILKGAKPADLPVQQPRKFEFFVNLKTARAIGLTLPPTLLVRATELLDGP